MQSADLDKERLATERPYLHLYLMVEHVTAFLVATCLDLLIFLGILLSFSVIKNLRNRQLNPLPGEVMPRPTYSETEYSLTDLMRKVYQVDHDQFVAYCKAEGGLYQDFTRYVIYLLLGLSVAGCGVLVPLYVTRDNQEEETDLTGIGQVAKSDHKSIALCFTMLALFSIVFYVFAFFFYRLSLDAHITSAVATSPIQECCIMVTHIPRPLSPDSYNEAFFCVFNSVLPGGVTSAYILPDYELVEEEYQRLLKIRERIEHYKAYENV